MGKSYLSIGEIISLVRKKSGLTQDALAEGICTTRYLSKIENKQCIPTLEIVAMLSERLNTNLLEEYAKMLNHINFQTHEYIISINETLRTHDFNHLKEIVDEADCLDSFKYGEPKFIIEYAKACLASNLELDSYKAIEIAKESVSNIINESAKICGKPCNAELCSLLLLANNYARVDQKEESLKIYTMLSDYLLSLNLLSAYEINTGYHFEVNFAGKVISLFFLYHPDFFDQKGFVLDTAIEFLKKNSCTLNLPQLILCKAKMEYSKCPEEGIRLKEEAFSLCKIIYGEKALFELTHTSFNFDTV